MQKISFSLAVSTVLAFSATTGGQRRVPGESGGGSLSDAVRREHLSQMRGQWLELQAGPLKRGLKPDAEECKQLIALLRTL